MLVPALVIASDSELGLGLELDSDSELGICLEPVADSEYDLGLGSEFVVGLYYYLGLDFDLFPVFGSELGLDSGHDFDHVSAHDHAPVGGHHLQSLLSARSPTWPHIARH